MEELQVHAFEIILHSGSSDNGSQLSLICEKDTMMKRLKKLAANTELLEEYHVNKQTCCKNVLRNRNQIENIMAWHA